MTSPGLADDELVEAAFVEAMLAAIRRTLVTIAANAEDPLGYRERLIAMARTGALEASASATAIDPSVALERAKRFADLASRAVERASDDWSRGREPEGQPIH